MFSVSRIKVTSLHSLKTPPRPLTLESAIEFISVDELVEVTPASIRLRKRLLSAHDRRRERSREEDLSHPAE